MAKRQASSDPDYNPSGNTSKRAKDAKQEGKKQSPRRKQKPKTKGFLEKEGIQARKDLKSMKQDLEKLENENRELRAALRHKSTPDHVIDDKAIQHKFDELTADVYNWTREYSCDVQASEQAVRYLKKHSRLSSTEWLSCSDEDLSEMSRLPFSCNIFLNALVMRFIYEVFIRDPFATLYESFSQRRGASGCKYTLREISLMLQQLANKFNNDNRYKTAKWISHTLKMIYPPEDKPIEHSSQDLKTLYEDTADEILSIAANGLIRKDIDLDERKEELISLLKEANELRIDIWKQSMNIKFHLLGSKTLGEALEPEPHIMQLHCTVPENTKPGARLRMAITPAVAAYWLDSAGNEQKKVWAKAVVWAGSPKEWESNRAFDACIDDTPNKGHHEELGVSTSESATDSKKDHPTATPSEVKTEPSETSAISR